MHAANAPLPKGRVGVGEMCLSNAAAALSGRRPTHPPLTPRPAQGARRAGTPFSHFFAFLGWKSGEKKRTGLLVAGTSTVERAHVEGRRSSCMGPAGAAAEPTAIEPANAPAKT